MASEPLLSQIHTLSCRLAASEASGSRLPAPDARLRMRVETRECGRACGVQVSSSARTLDLFVAESSSPGALARLAAHPLCSAATRKCYLLRGLRSAAGVLTVRCSDAGQRRADLSPSKRLFVCSFVCSLVSLSLSPKTTTKAAFWFPRLFLGCAHSLG